MSEGIKTVSDLEGFLASATKALCEDARSMLGAEAQDPHAWTYALLALATERAAYEVRQQLSPEAYEMARRVVALHAQGVRDAANSIEARKGAEARLIAVTLDR